MSVPLLPGQAAIAPGLDRAEPHVRRCMQESHRQIGLLRKHWTGPIEGVGKGKLYARETAGELSEVGFLGEDNAAAVSSGVAAAHRTGMGDAPELAEASDERGAGQCRCL